MSGPRSDALVFFGATGDLAYKKIFPSLHAMAKSSMNEVTKKATKRNVMFCLGFSCDPAGR